MTSAVAIDAMKNQYGETARNAAGVPAYQTSVLIPSPLTGAENAMLSRARLDMMDLLALRASDVLSRKIGQIVVRSIYPKTDLGLTNEAWLVGSAPTANTFSAYISKALSSTQLLAIYGVCDLTPSPQLDEIQFLSGTAKTLVRVHVEEMFAFTDGAVGIISPRVIWNPSDTVTVQIYASGTATERIVLLGFEAEQVDVNVSPPSYNEA